MTLAGRASRRRIPRRAPYAVEPARQSGVAAMSVIGQDDVTVEEVIEAVQEALVAVERHGAPSWDAFGREAFAHDAASEFVARRARGAIELGRVADGRRSRARRHPSCAGGVLPRRKVPDAARPARGHGHHGQRGRPHLAPVRQRPRRAIPAPTVSRRGRPAGRSRASRPSVGRHRAPIRRRQAAARAATVRRLSARRDHERVVDAASVDPTQRPARRHPRRARSPGHGRPGHRVAVGGGHAVTDAGGRVRRDGRRQDDVRPGDDQRAPRRPRGSWSSRTPAS